jgi:hypothetical protein
MKVQVPEAVHVRDFVRAPLARHERLAVRGLAMAMFSGAHEALALHEAAHGRVARHRPEAWLLAGERDEVVVVQLEAPARVVAMLLGDGFGERGAETRMRPGVGGDLARQRGEWIVGGAGDVPPALDALEGEVEGLVHAPPLETVTTQISFAVQEAQEGTGIPPSGAGASSGPASTSHAQPPSSNCQVSLVVLHAHSPPQQIFPGEHAAMPGLQAAPAVGFATQPASPADDSSSTSPAGPSRSCMAWPTFAATQPCSFFTGAEVTVGLRTPAGTTSSLNCAIRTSLAASAGVISPRPAAPCRDRPSPRLLAGSPRSEGPGPLVSSSPGLPFHASAFVGGVRS